MPEWHEELGVYTQITPEVLRKVIKENPGARAIVITNPSYQGFCPDLKEICEIARQNNMLVLVDEAHGPHLAFSPHLPPTAGDFEVDAWVQSPHKMLSSLTQSAWLHVKGERIDKERLSSYLGMVTSTSPSYILMASLDYARALMERRGRHLVEKALNMAGIARTFINMHTDFYCAGDELKGRAGISDIDLSRLMVNVSGAGFTGFEVESLLRREFNIYAEYADLCNVYFLITFGNKKKDIETLTDALRTLSYRDPKDPNPGSGQDNANTGELLGLYSGIMKKLPQKAMEPREAFVSKGEWVPLECAAGRIVKKALVPYPPGVPLLMPGEIMENEHVDLIENLVEAGCTVQGAHNGSIYVISF
jgi:lysine decarboxylase